MPLCHTCFEHTCMSVTESSATESSHLWSCCHTKEKESWIRRRDIGREEVKKGIIKRNFHEKKGEGSCCASINCKGRFWYSCSMLWVMSCSRLLHWAVTAFSIAVSACIQNTANAHGVGRNNSVVLQTQKTAGSAAHRMFLCTCSQLIWCGKRGQGVFSPAFTGLCFAQWSQLLTWLFTL